MNNLETMALEINDNESAIREVGNIQCSTKESLNRINQQLSETEFSGKATLELLREQRYQTERIAIDAENLDAQLTKTAKLQNRFDRWKGHWLGMKRRAARAEAKEDLAKTEQTIQKNLVGKVYNSTDALEVQQSEKKNTNHWYNSPCDKENSRLSVNRQDETSSSLSMRLRASSDSASSGDGVSSCWLTESLLFSLSQGELYQ